MYEYAFRLNYTDGTFSIETVAAENYGEAMNLILMGIEPTELREKPSLIGTVDLEPQECLAFA